MPQWLDTLLKILGVGAVPLLIYMIKVSRAILKAFKDQSTLLNQHTREIERLSLDMSMMRNRCQDRGKENAMQWGKIDLVAKRLDEHMQRDFELHEKISGQLGEIAGCVKSLKDR